ncbi:family 16 glycoside hydrolase [Melampsora americana]|nr:family 16 glycoside hydrolase [Melampsora americana]
MCLNSSRTFYLRLIIIIVLITFVTTGLASIICFVSTKAVVAKEYNSEQKAYTWTLRSQAAGNELVEFFEKVAYHFTIKQQRTISLLQVTCQTNKFFLGYRISFETFNNGSQGGLARYVNLQEGYRSSMIGTKEGTLYFGVDTTPYSTNRKSFRLVSKHTFTTGSLVIVDVLHMPAACGAWPSLWTVAKDAWPEKGELDIIEGVNLFTQNSLSAHTKPGFWMKPTGFTSEFMLKGAQQVNQTNCDAIGTNDQGCGLRDRAVNSFGEPFNAGQGGVFVLEWTAEAISMYFFPRESIPRDITSGSPSRTSLWGHPRARFQGNEGQAINDYFQDHSLVVNTNLCGKWPDYLWNSNTSDSGQSINCAALTGAKTCQDFITNSGNKLKEAYWAIKSVKLYS